jgi:hypothetical protein
MYYLPFSVLKTKKIKLDDNLNMLPIYIYIYCNTILINMCDDGWMVEVLGCCQRSEGSNPTLDMLCLWCYHGDLS